MGIIIFLIILVVIWQGAYWIFVDILEVFKSYVLPSPIGVAERFIDLCQSGTLLHATGFSLARGFLGYIIAIAIGLVIGLL